MSHGSAISLTWLTVGILLHQFEEGAQPVDVVELPRQRRGEVEAEPVDVHLADPVAQRVHDQLQRSAGWPTLRLLPVPV